MGVPVPSGGKGLERRCRTRAAVRIAAAPWIHPQVHHVVQHTNVVGPAVRLGDGQLGPGGGQPASGPLLQRPMGTMASTVLIDSESKQQPHGPRSRGETGGVTRKAWLVRQQRRSGRPAKLTLAAVAAIARSSSTGDACSFTCDIPLAAFQSLQELRRSSSSRRRLVPAAPDIFERPVLASLTDFASLPSGYVQPVRRC
jgi:hypothetical protein